MPSAWGWPSRSARPCGGCDQPLGPPPGRASLAGHMDGFPSQCQCDPERLAGLKGKQQAPGLVVRAADHVDHTDADGHRAVNVDQLEFLCRNLVGRAVAKAHAADPESGPAQEQAQQCPSRRAGQGEPNGVEDRSEGRRALRRCAR